MKNKMISILATVGPIIGLALTALTDWAANKEQDRIIEEKVNEAIANYGQDGES